LLAQALAENGDLDEAESLNLQALSLWKKLRGSDDPKVAASLNNLGNVYFRRRDLDRAKDCFEQALAIWRPIDDPNTSAALHNVANVLALQNRFAAAEKLYREAVTLARQRHGDLHPTTALYLRNLGDVLRAQGKLEEAAAAHGEALTARATLLDELHPLLTDSFERLAVVKTQQGQLAEAEMLYRKALAARRQRAPDDPRQWDNDASELANLLNQQHRFTDAEELLSQLVATREHDPKAARLYAIRGSARARHGDWSNAVPDLSRAVELAPDEHWYATLLAPLLVESGNRKAYDAFCRDCLARFAGATNHDVAVRMALACLLAPSKDTDLPAANRLLDSALSDPKYGGKVYAAGPKALAEYRGGRPADAIVRLEELLEGLANGKWQTGRFVPVQAHAIRAMAHEALGHHDKAREALARARDVAPGKIATPTNGDYGGSWHEWLMLHIYLREARTLIEGASDGTAGR
jgi:tetratricopeptide (TPR) repeat protein